MSSADELIEKYAFKYGMREETYKERIYHYTSLDAFNEILNSKNKLVYNLGSPLSFHISHILFQNDPTETQFGLKLIVDELSKLIDEFHQNKDTYKKDIKRRGFAEKLSANLVTRLCTDPYIINQFLDRFKNVYSNSNKSIEDISFASTEQKFSVFTGSFSAVRDDLSQWRGYGDNAKGVCLGFDTKILKEYLGTRYPINIFTKVRYYPQDFVYENVSNFLRDILSEVEDSPNPSDFYKGENCLLTKTVILMLELIASTKLDLYSKEEEYRIFMPRLENENLDDIDLKVKQNVLTPYINFPLPENVLKEVILGPTANWDRNEKSLNLIKRKFGLDFEITKSILPYR